MKARPRALHTPRHPPQFPLRQVVAPTRRAPGSLSRIARRRIACRRRFVLLGRCRSVSSYSHWCWGWVPRGRRTSAPSRWRSWRGRRPRRGSRRWWTRRRRRAGGSVAPGLRAAALRAYETGSGYVPAWYYLHRWADLLATPLQQVPARMDQGGGEGRSWSPQHGAALRLSRRFAVDRTAT
jgi:hypothetical protein